MGDYNEFLASKVVAAPNVGFHADEAGWDFLKPFQAHICRWALELGRAAIFADCGLGKTVMQLVWGNEICANTDRPVLILAPLAVAGQTAREGEKFGIPVNICRSSASVRPGINVTNYQKLLDRNGEGLSDQWDVSVFAGVVLDESSILKSFMGKTKRLLCEAFKATDYRLCCTATPAPNDHLELGNHSQFLGVMDSDEMISRWFINDTSEAGAYRLKRHAEKSFWRWVASWAVCIGKPSDLGYSDEGYELPPLEIVEEIVDVDATSGAQAGFLWRDADLTATSLHQEMRMTTQPRASRVAALASDPEECWVVWCNTNYEADALRTMLPDACEVRGSDSEDAKEEKLAAFADGSRRVIITKPSITSFGLNWQHCSHVAFVGLSYSHEQMYQAIRRSWRFGQKRPVRCHIISASTEGGVLATIRNKERKLEEMRRQMVAATREATEEARKELCMVDQQIAKSDGTHTVVTEADGRVIVTRNSDQKPARASLAATLRTPVWDVRLGDCVPWARSFERASVDFTVFSPPFSSLYIYSDSLADMGNSASDDEFFRHFGYLVPELYRITVPGRLCAVHCKDLPKYHGRDGAAGLKDFPGALVRLFEEHGWTFHSRVTIWKSPVTEMTRTKNQGLLYKQIRADSCYSRQGMADYLLVFRKWEGAEGGFPKPVTHPTPHEILCGLTDGELTPEQANAVEQFPLDQWQQWASPVWMDIDQTHTLNYRLAKDGSDERHICPLQLEVIRRAVRLWSNPGDLVFSPFAGIGSEGFVSVCEGRRFLGTELKESYWQIAQRHLAEAEFQARQKSLTDFMGVEDAAA